MGGAPPLARDPGAAGPARGIGRPPPDLRPGTVIAEKYRIDRELGRGGFGVVVRATHLALDQRVAIKVLTEAEGATEAEWAEDAERFRREAMATASLRSEHVVRVLDVDVLDGGYPYIVMEYLDGQTMHDLTYTSRAPLRADEVADYGVQMLAALAEAHGAGFVHRDLKPANVFLSTGIGGAPLVKVLDFGVSKVMEAASLRLTRTGAMVGTLAYMAPEQMRDARRVDGRADLWSVGVVLYEALARAHPFDAHSAGPKVVTAILGSPVPSLQPVRPDVPPGLEAVIGRLLEKSPERRFATAAEAAAELAPFATARSRPVLDAIARMPPPRGAAAPRAAAVPHEPRAAALQPPERPGATSALVRFLVAFLAAVIVLGALAFAGLYVEQRLARPAEPTEPAGR